jgi:hypothetical protein
MCNLFKLIGLFNFTQNYNWNSSPNYIIMPGVTELLELTVEVGTACNFLMVSDGTRVKV